MTTKIPDAVIEKAQRAVIDLQVIADSYAPEIANAVLQALDLSGIIKTLEWYAYQDHYYHNYGDYGAAFEDQGHRARERLGKLLNEGGRG